MLSTSSLTLRRCRKISWALYNPLFLQPGEWWNPFLTWSHPEEVAFSRTFWMMVYFNVPSLTMEALSVLFYRWEQTRLTGLDRSLEISAALADTVAGPWETLEQKHRQATSRLPAGTNGQMIIPSEGTSFGLISPLPQTQAPSFCYSPIIRARVAGFQGSFYHFRCLKELHFYHLHLRPFTRKSVHTAEWTYPICDIETGQSRDEYLI